MKRNSSDIKRITLIIGILFALSVAHPRASGNIDDKTTAQILIVKSSDSSFYAPTLKGFISGLQRREQGNGISIHFQTMALTGEKRNDAHALQERLKQKSRLIVTLGTDATVMTASMHPSIPALFTLVLDPISLGIAKSLDDPGGDFSGVTLLVNPGKQLEILQEADPSVKRVGVLYTNDDPTSIAFLKQADTAAKQLNLTLKTAAVNPSDQITSVLKQFDNQVDALWIIADPSSTGANSLSATLAYARIHKLPVLGLSSATVHAGALAALSPNMEDLGDETADMAVGILNGEQTPAVMRVRGPLRTLLCLNLDAARALSIKLPSEMLHLADEVVDSSRTP